MDEHISLHQLQSDDQKNIRPKHPIHDYRLNAVLSPLRLYTVFLIGKATIITIPEEARGVMFNRFDGGPKVEKYKTLDIKYNFNPILGKICHVHDEIGPTYRECIIKPEISLAVREVMRKSNH